MEKRSIDCRFRILTAFILIVITGLSGTLIARDRIEEFGLSMDSIVNETNGRVSIQITSADKYDMIYLHNPEEKMIPASITKLITAAVAIDVLGINFDFKTVVYTDDSDIKDGVINGNVYLKGFGDPDLNSSDITYLAKEVVSKGIKEITGNIIYDESYLDDNHYGLANFYSGDTKQGYWPYVSAINLNKNPGQIDPAATAAEILMSELTSMGVTASGITLGGETPTGAKELAVMSHSLYDVISHMNKESDNHSAITVFKVVGAEYKSAPGSLEKGESAVVDFLTQIGNPRGAFDIVEGSGLSRFNTVNSDLYIRMLKYMYDDVKTFDYFYGSLAIAGVDGTLRNRMTGTEAEKNVHAKTGTLNSVSTLAGYAVSRDNELMIFYIAMNGFGGGHSGARYRQDMMCAALCRFSRTSN
ncbi:MAG: D-alanyl-D-alanine carboxypeptidase/D-alanyl-D-alanine-endopeptidase [Ignavibacteria bacterium]|nr:D-alanyl-D-alanine carboxypeptidase/D-alanyl-D-alanine-endopeptidase [Ignavibacteria bacterium]MBK9225953.1 D-alanyl-D-alanine carboxypeptidase/D-alanyl-D-alanine-endopeptidase [Ignavibacteria bacterium]